MLIEKARFKSLHLVWSHLRGILEKGIYPDKKHICSWQGSVGHGRELTTKGTRKHSGLLKIFCIMIVVVVTLLYAFIKPSELHI